MQDNSNSSPLNGSSPTNSANGFKQFATKNKKVLTCAAIAIAVFLVLFGVYTLGYNKGEDKGYNKGKDEAAKKASQLDPLSLMSEANRNYWSIVGTVEAVDGSSITVKNNKGKVEKATFNEDLTVTQKSNKDGANKSSIKTGQNVIVIGQKNDGKLTASRITIKE